MNSEEDRSLQILMAQAMRKPVTKCLLKNRGNCTPTIVKAHSIQNSYILDQLQEDGHVYMLKPDGSSPFPVLDRIGRNKATVFSGFCSHHDSHVFREIDLTPGQAYNKDNPKQACLYFLRACAHEYWKKLNVIENFEQVLAGSLPGFTPSANKELFFELLSTYLKNVRMGVKELKSQFESLLCQCKRDKYHLTSVETKILGFPCKFAASAAFTPFFDVTGSKLFDRCSAQINHRWPILSTLVMPAHTETIIQFCAHRRDHGILQKFIEPMLMSKPEEYQQGLSQAIVSNCENIVFAPKLVEALSDEEKEGLCRVFAETSLSESESHVPNLFN